MTVIQEAVDVETTLLSAAESPPDAIQRRVVVSPKRRTITGVVFEACQPETVGVFHPARRYR